MIVQLLMSDQVHVLFDFGMPRVRALAAVLLLHFDMATHDFAVTKLPVKMVCGAFDQCHAHISSAVISELL